MASRMKFLISHVIQHQLKDPRIGLLTVLDVMPTKDLKEAKVYVSVLGSSGDRSKAEHALHGARAYIQNEVGQNLETRNTPILRFVFDDSAEKVSRIEGLIQKANQQDRESTMAKKPSKETQEPELHDGQPSPIDARQADEASDEKNGEDPAKEDDDFGTDFDDEEDDDDMDIDDDFDEDDDEEADDDEFEKEGGGDRDPGDAVVDGDDDDDDGDDGDEDDNDDEEADDDDEEADDDDEDDDEDEDDLDKGD